VHRITDANSDQLFYEIHAPELNKDYLWDTQLKKTAIGNGYGGQSVGNRVVRWLLKDNRILLVNMDYSSVADPSNVLMDEANQPAIIQAFPVQAYKGDDKNAGDPVINVTTLFTGNVAEFAAGRGVGGTGAPDPARTFLEKANAYPQNINVEVTATWAIAEQAADADRRRWRRTRRTRRWRRAQPQRHGARAPQHGQAAGKPMMPRLFDERVGYFTQGLTDYGTGEQQQMQKRFITRYRLEKKDPNAAISDPVKPITYYIDPETPKKWVPCIKAAIESWQPAFELAGFRKGIVAKEASESGDPNWSREDVRYSTIDYLPSTTENAVGPHVHDPRSGEILEADVQYYHNVMNLAKNWYFVQAGPNDPKAQQLPLPEDLMCNLIKYVVAHEVGHTLGFQHNMKASSTYTIEQIRDPKWVKENGHTPTLMDYSRFNLRGPARGQDRPDRSHPEDWPVRQMGDALGLRADSGREDAGGRETHARQMGARAGREAVSALLDRGRRGDRSGDETEAVGDIDATKATALGIKNLARVSEMLMKATNYKTGDPYDELEEVYGRMVGQWTTEMNHVVKVDRRHRVAAETHRSDRAAVCHRREVAAAGGPAVPDQ
jgi:hypothetical protein